LSFMEPAEIEFCIDSYERACLDRSFGQESAQVHPPHEEDGQALMPELQEADAAAASAEQSWTGSWEWNAHYSDGSDNKWDSSDWHDQWKEETTHGSSWDWGNGGKKEFEAFYDAQTKPQKGDQKGAGKGTSEGNAKGKSDGKDSNPGKAAGKKGKQETVKGENANSNGGKAAGKTGTKGSRKLYIGNLPSDVNEDELKGMFGQFGRIEDIYVMQGRSKRTGQSCAMLLYYSQADSDRCMLATASGFEVRSGEGDLVVKYADDQDTPGTHIQNAHGGRGKRSKGWD